MLQITKTPAEIIYGLIAARDSDQVEELLEAFLADIMDSTILAMSAVDVEEETQMHVSNTVEDYFCNTYC